MKNPYIVKPDKITRAYLFQLLSDYPAMKNWVKENTAALMPSTVPNYNSSPVGGEEESRPTESTAIKIISDRTLCMWEWKIKAVESTLEKVSETDKKIIALCFWGNPQISYAAAGEIISMTAQGVKYRVDSIISMLAFYCGENRPPAEK